MADTAQRPPDEIEALVLACLEAEDPLAELERRTAGDPQLRAAALAVLQQVQRCEREVDGNVAGAPMPPTPRPELPAKIGRYHVLAEIGAGGMGVVYLAEEREPVRRRVALKVIKLGMDTRAVLARFEVERQALALMDHAAIARVFEAGSTADGRPYFAMEYVKGVPITRYCDDQRLSIEERLRLFQQVCRGVQHAHQKGVIHRDLTPSNVLVTVQDGQPAVKIIDFGLARATDHRLTERTLFTEHGYILGTPEYMSPEQAGLGGLDVDMRSDVYTLGVLLYELLTGALPFTREELRETSYDAMCRTIREKEPERPSTKITRSGTAAVAAQRRTDVPTLLGRLRGDLDWVALKCLEKDRSRRYDTVSELAADVQRHLEFEPVTARPPTLGYRLQKLARRYRPQLLAAGLVLAALLLGLCGTIWFALQAGDRAREAEQARIGESQRAAEARQNAELLAAKVQEFDLLAAVVQLDQAIASEKSLYPPWPAQIEAMQRWLDEQANGLLAMQPQIDATVASLRARGSLLADGKTLRFPSESQRFLHDTLAGVQGKLRAFVDKDHKTIVECLAWARRIERLTLQHPNARASWAQARAAIAKADGVVASRRYAAMPIDLQPQLGLVPIGMNPRTQLWEFYELRSAWDPFGDVDPAALEIPQHDADGRIAVGDGTGIVFVLIPGGTFTMGAQAQDPRAPNHDPAAEPDEAPRQVTLQPFFLARHEMTQGQWKRVTLALQPSNYKAGERVGEQTIGFTNPVEQVPWPKCEWWLQSLGCVLPTEAQWEFACRAGTGTPWWTGADRESLRGAANLADQTARRAGATWAEIAEWPDFDDGFSVHAPVDALRDNPFGLFHVHGNVWEWCQDWYGTGDAPLRPGDGLRLCEPGSSPQKVTRGGSFSDSAAHARAADRGQLAETVQGSMLGVRPARLLLRDGPGVAAGR